MALKAGDRLGHYQILSALGAGGMGEVFRARDTKLHRDVAVKIVADGFASDPERLARFIREAHTLAALNHPHIAHIYGIEETGESRALVMELVEGEDLARRLSRGRLPLAEALTLARQLAEAVEAAHEKGIVHRDLKPSNVMLDGDGRVRVLDFGLATAPEAQPSSDSASAATITSPAKLTGRGVIVGTPSYMSPEQITGQAADKRCDVWAFGCVLFEMLSGKRTFDAADTHEAMMAVASREPDWDALPADVPAGVRKLLKRCLDKNRKRRLSDMSAVRLELEDAMHAPSVPPVSTAEHAPPKRRFGLAVVLPWAVAALAVATAAIALARTNSAAATPRPMVRVAADVGAPVSLATTQGVATILSPDGTRIVFAGQPRAENIVPRLYTRKLDQLSATPIPGTDGAMNPFFSPDGQSVGFFAAGKLKKIALSGGAAVELADTPNGRGGSWGDDNHIVYMPDFYAGLWRVPAAGGPPVQLTTPATPAATHRWPNVLPGSKGVLFTSNSQITGYENSEIVLQPLPSGTPRVIWKNGMHGQYLASGHLVFMHQGAMFAAGFDLDRLERTSEPVPVIDDVSGGPFWTGVAQFAASNDGTAVYLSGKHLATAVSSVDDKGAVTTLRADVENWGSPAFSRDGRRLAFEVFDGKQTDIWVHDFNDNTFSRLTHDPKNEAKPVWSSDGRRIIFGIVRDDGGFSIAWHNADGSGTTQALWSAPNQTVAASVHPSGKFISYIDVDRKTSFDIKILPIIEDANGDWKAGQPMTLADTAAVELEPMFSPDGRWIAYSSTVSGRSEIYVKPFPGPGGTWQVSTGGGAYPTWSRATNELLYATLDQRLMAVRYTAEGGSFRASPARVWTTERHRVLGPTIVRSYDLHPDGKRIAFARAADAADTASDPVVMVFNFFDELRRLVPSAR